MSDFGRWPWSWPAEVPVVIQTPDEKHTLTERGVFGGDGSSVGKGYRGVSEIPCKTNVIDGPIHLEVTIGKKYLRNRLRSGEWVVIGTPDTANSS